MDYFQWLIFICLLLQCWGCHFGLTPIQPRQHTHQRIVLNDIVMEQRCGGMQPDQPIAESRQRLMPADNRPRLRPVGNLGEGHRQAE